MFQKCIVQRRVALAILVGTVLSAQAGMAMWEEGSAAADDSPRREVAAAHAPLPDFLCAPEARREKEADLEFLRSEYGKHFDIYRTLLRMIEQEDARKEAAKKFAEQRADAERVQLAEKTKMATEYKRLQKRTEELASRLRIVERFGAQGGIFSQSHGGMQGGGFLCVPCRAMSAQELERFVLSGENWGEEPSVRRYAEAQYLKLWLPEEAQEIYVAGFRDAPTGDGRSAYLKEAHDCARDLGLPALLDRCLSDIEEHAQKIAAHREKMAAHGRADPAERQAAPSDDMEGRLTVLEIEQLTFFKLAYQGYANACRALSTTLETWDEGDQAGKAAADTVSLEELKARLHMATEALQAARARAELTLPLAQRIEETFVATELAKVTAGEAAGVS